MRSLSDDHSLNIERIPDSKAAVSAISGWDFCGLVGRRRSGSWPTGAAAETLSSFRETWLGATFGVILDTVREMDNMYGNYEIYSNYLILASEFLRFLNY